MSQLEEDWKRHYRWCSLIPGYSLMTKTAKKHAKQDYKDDQKLLKEGVFMYEEKASAWVWGVAPTAAPKQKEVAPKKQKVATPVTVTYTLDDYVCLSTQPSVFDTNWVQKIEKEKTMTHEQEQKEYLKRRLSSIYGNKDAALQRHFNIIGDEAPETMKEMAERIQNGRFVLPEMYEGWDTYHFNSVIQWRDPKAVADKDGYAKAQKELVKAKTEANDIIVVGTPAEGLKAIQDLEAKTFH